MQCSSSYNISVSDTCTLINRQLTRNPRICYTAVFRATRHVPRDHDTVVKGTIVASYCEIHRSAEVACRPHSQAFLVLGVANSLTRLDKGGSPQRRTKGRQTECACITLLRKFEGEYQNNTPSPNSFVSTRYQSNDLWYDVSRRFSRFRRGERDTSTFSAMYRGGGISRI